MILKCPNCGGAVMYDPVTGHTKCAQCGNIVKKAFCLKNDGEAPVPETCETGFIGDPFFNNNEDVKKNNSSGLKLSDKVVETVEKEDSKIDFDNLWYGLKKGQCWGNMKNELGENYVENDELDDFIDISNSIPKNSMEVKLYKCTSCGAKLMVHQNEASTFCAFCGHPTIVFDRLSNEKQPDYIIPFKISDKEAEQKIRERFSSGSFIPKEIKNFTVDKLRGIYVPFWLYSCHMRKKANIRIPETDENRPKDSSYNMTIWPSQQINPKSLLIDNNKQYRDVEGSFNKLAFDASSKLNDDLSQRIVPYDISELEPFKPSYLSGFYTDRYDVGSRDVAVNAFKTCNQYMNTEILNSCDPKSIISKEIYQYYVENIEYALLPVWFFTFRYQGQSYTILVNGQNGKVVGNVPFDKPKAILQCAITILGASFLTIPIMLELGLRAPKSSTKFMWYILFASVVILSSGITKMKKYLKDSYKFTSTNINQYVGERQDKTWLQ